jgi:hypothetical protein
MFDSMFGNMSPVFPFDTNPLSQNATATTDSMGVGAFGGSGGGANDTFASWTNDFSNNGFNVGTQNPAFGATANSSANHNIGNVGQPNVSHGQNGGFDLNSAWTAWTNGGSANSGQLAATNQVSQPTFDMSGNQLGMLDGRSGRPSTAPAGDGRPQNSPRQALPQSAGNPTMMNPASTLTFDASRPIGTSPFDLSHPGMQGSQSFRNSRATPSEVYRTVVKP